MINTLPYYQGLYRLLQWALFLSFNDDFHCFPSDRAVELAEPFPPHLHVRLHSCKIPESYFFNQVLPGSYGGGVSHEYKTDMLLSSTHLCNATCWGDCVVCSQALSNGNSIPGIVVLLLSPWQRSAVVPQCTPPAFDLSYLHPPDTSWEICKK